METTNSTPAVQTPLASITVPHPHVDLGRDTGHVPDKARRKSSSTTKCDLATQPSSLLVGNGVDALPTGPCGIDLVDRATGEIIGQAPCRSRNCPDCGPRLKDSYVLHFVDQFRDRSGPIVFSGGVDPNIVNAPSRRAYMDLLGDTMSNFTESLTRTARRFGGELAYFGAREYSGSGLPHSHMLFSWDVPGVPKTEALDLIFDRWYRRSGDLAAHVAPLKGGEEGLRGWAYYVLKNQFYPDNQGFSIRASHNVGYGSESAVAERKKYVTPDPEGVIFDAEPRSKKGAPASRSGRPRLKATIDLESLRKSGVKLVSESRYGVRTRALPRRGLEFDVVRRPKAEEGIGDITLHENVGTMAEAYAIAEAYAGGPDGGR